MAFEPGQRANIPTPILTDAQMFRGVLYILGGGWLHQIDSQTGKLKSITSFYGTGKNFAEGATPNCGITISGR